MSLPSRLLGAKCCTDRAKVGGDGRAQFSSLWPDNWAEEQIGQFCFDFEVLEV